MTAPMRISIWLAFTVVVVAATLFVKYAHGLWQMIFAWVLFWCAVNSYARITRGRPM